MHWPFLALENMENENISDLIFSEAPAQLVTAVVQKLSDSVADSQNTFLLLLRLHLGLLLLAPVPPPGPPLQPGRDLPDLVAGADLVVLPCLLILPGLTLSRQCGVGCGGLVITES